MANQTIGDLTAIAAVLSGTLFEAEDVGGTAASRKVTAAQIEAFLNALKKSGGSMTGALELAASADISSATATDLGAATTNTLRITGTTTINSFGTAAAGVFRHVRFAAVLTLTYNATSMILPGAASITTAADDTALFVSEGSGNWRCWSYQRAATAP